MSASDFVLTAEEKRAIAALKRIAKIWPKSLWLFSANGDLNAMRCDDNGDRVFIKDCGGVDPNYVVEDGIKIPNDGGDW